MPITYDFMAQLQKKLVCSEKKLLMIAREFKTKGMKFESHIREDLEQLSHSLDDFYTVETLEFEEKKEKSLEVAKVMLDLVYVNNPTVFIDMQQYYSYKPPLPEYSNKSLNMNRLDEITVFQYSLYQK